MLGGAAPYLRGKSPRRIAFEPASSRTSNSRRSPASNSIEAGTPDQSTARSTRKAKPSAAGAAVPLNARPLPAYVPSGSRNSLVDSPTSRRRRLAQRTGSHSSTDRSEARERSSATEDASVDAGAGRLARRRCDRPRAGRELAGGQEHVSTTAVRTPGQCRGLRLASGARMASREEQRSSSEFSDTGPVPGECWRLVHRLLLIESPARSTCFGWRFRGGGLRCRVGFGSPSLRRIEETWWSTVFCDRKSRSAISLLRSPPARRVRTWSSRGVRLAGFARGVGRWPRGTLSTP